MNQMVDKAVGEVFRTMLSLNVQQSPGLGLAANGQPHVASAVGFIGRLSGVIYLYTSDAFARKLTAGLLGLEPGEVDGAEMVNDAMGELANMVVGNIKSRLSDRGMPCVLTIPSIVRGNHFTIEPVRNAERVVLGFTCGSDQLVVEVMLKPGELETVPAEAA